MTFDDSGIDPNHAQTKRALNRVALGLLVVGIPLALIGFIVFVSVYFNGMDPATANSTGQHAVIGLLMAGAGGFMAAFGANLLFRTNLGRIARYEVQEGLPVAKAALRDVTPAISQTVRELSGAIKPVSQSGRFCPSCGANLGMEAHFCEQCGAKLDSAA